MIHTDGMYYLEKATDELLEFYDKPGIFDDLDSGDKAAWHELRMLSITLRLAAFLRDVQKVVAKYEKRPKQGKEAVPNGKESHQI